MSDFLSTLTNGQAPLNVNSSSGSILSQPDWYQQLMRGIGARSAQIADRGYQYYSDPRLANFTPDQQAAFQGIRDQQGAWKPAIQGGMSAAGQATQAVQGPAQSWTNNWQQYMSPYTQSVVDEIGRLGNRNLNENILPSINNSFIGNGGFGSDRNADMIGRAVRDTQHDISGLQSQALQQGYGTSANIFAQDANRQQQQQGMQAQTNLGAASTMGALGQMGQQLGYGDTSQLYGAGSAQQGLQQKGYDLGYDEFQKQVNYPWEQVNNMSTILQRMQVPTSQVGQSNAPLPGAGYGASPLAQAGALWQAFGGYGGGSGGSSSTGSLGGWTPGSGGGAWGGANDWETYGG